MEYHDIFGCDRGLSRLHVGTPDIYLPVQEGD